MADNHGPLAKRAKTSGVVASSRSSARTTSNIFAPFRTVGLVSPTNVPFTSVPLGKTTFQITTSVGRSLQTYDVRRGLNLVFVTRPLTPARITATQTWKKKVLAAWGNTTEQTDANDVRQGLWVFQRGKKVDELKLPADLDEPITQILIFGSWIIAAAETRIEVFKSDTLAHYTTIHIISSARDGNFISGGITNVPTFLNKIFVGRRDGWVDIWNVSTGKLIYSIVPPAKNMGGVTCLQPSPALAMLAIAYSQGPVIIQNVLTDKLLLHLEAGTPQTPVQSISFRTDGVGAGREGREDGVMATSTTRTGDVTFWDLNKGGRIMGILRSAHNPPVSNAAPNAVRGGISKIEFLHGQPVIVSSGLDNSLKTWIFDETPFSPVPRILHTRSGHAGPVTSIEFLPSDFDGSEAGNKWLLTGGQDRSLWGWSLRRDGQSTELSQGNLRRKAKQAGILSTSALAHGPTTTLDDIKAPEITCIASSLNRDGGMGAMPGNIHTWTKVNPKAGPMLHSAEVSAMTGWESVVTGHKNDPYARTWFWGRKRAGRWAFPTNDRKNVSTVAITSCGNFALVGSEGGALDMFNLQSGNYRQQFPARVTTAQALAMRRQQALQADEVRQLEEEAESAETLQKFAPGTGKHQKAITGIVVDHMNKFVISCSLDGTIKFWSFLTGVLVHEINWAPQSAITACRYFAANELLAVSCDDGAIRVVDTSTRKTIREFWGCQGDIYDFCFSNDGRWIIASSQDCLIRVWDLPTGHLIDALKVERACKALAMSVTGEFLATSIDGELGVAIWTNKSLFRHVPTRQLSDAEIADMKAIMPSTTGEGNEGVLEAAIREEGDGDGEDDQDPALIVPTVDQLSSELMTLSLVPKAKWQTLLHLDVIKQRNKPKEAPKAPEKAPFFLPNAGNGAANAAAVAAAEAMLTTGAEKGTDQNDSTSSRHITAVERARNQDDFTDRLRHAAETGSYDGFIEYLKNLSPSRADFELRSLSLGAFGGESHTNELLHFIRAMTSRLLSRKDYELVQAWMTVFLRIHADAIMVSKELAEELHQWREHQKQESQRIDDLVGYCSGVVSFFRSPRV